MSRALVRRLSRQETRWFFTTDILRPERDADGYLFSDATGYFIAHGLGLHLAFYGSR